ncbi:hypothetical protein EDC94DRAFT_621130 [Helicostylum pulchrum]|nr:hypothetical protein EDC94DRAFT_621130 [Helicostylum pulchrum]
MRTNIQIKIDSILLSQAGPNQIAEWNNFVQEMHLKIIQECDGCNLNKYKGIWKELFKGTVRKLKLNLESSETDLWSDVVTKKLKEEKIMQVHLP